VLARCRARVVPLRCARVLRASSLFGVDCCGAGAGVGSLLGWLCGFSGGGYDEATWPWSVSPRNCVGTSDALSVHSITTVM